MNTGQKRDIKVFDPRVREEIQSANDNVLHRDEATVYAGATNAFNEYKDTTLKRRRQEVFRHARPKKLNLLSPRIISRGHRKTCLKKHKCNFAPYASLYMCRAERPELQRNKRKKYYFQRSREDAEKTDDKGRKVGRLFS